MTFPPVRSTLPLLVVALAVAAPTVLRAQSGQEKQIQERLERNGTLAYEPAGKSFSTEATFGGRQASVRSFAFGGRTANSQAGEGTFRARNFNDGRGGFHTASFTTRAAATDRPSSTQANRAFATRAVDVREDRGANRSLDTSRAYVNSEKPYLVPGKRQDEIDDLRKQKNLTVDQVREILNKNR